MTRNQDEEDERTLLGCLDLKDPNSIRTKKFKVVHANRYEDYEEGNGGGRSEKIV